MQYRVDATDRIVELCSDWNRFALGNDGARAMADRVLGRPLFDFITGDSSRLFMHAVLDGVRTLCRPRMLPYRCDSPSERRWFQMTAHPLPGGGVLLLHQLTASQPRRPPLQRAGVRRWCCSQCLASRPLGSQAWMQDDVTTVEVVGYDVCPSCSSRLFGGQDVETNMGSAHGR